MKPSEDGGEWWLPATPHRRVPGVLRISDDGAATLTLIGDLRDPWESVTRADGSAVPGLSTWSGGGSYRRVHGQVGTAAYTLDGGIQRRHQRNLLGGMPSETIGFSQVFVGVWFDESDEAASDRVSFGLQWLTEWTDTTAVAEEHRWRKDRRRLDRITLTATSGPARRVRLGGGRTLYLRRNLHAEGDARTARSLRQQYVFDYRTEVVPVRDLMDVPARLQALVSIATNRVAGFDDVDLSHPQIARRHPATGRRLREPIRYIAQWSARDHDDTAPTQEKILFTLVDFGGMPAVGRWLHVAEQYEHQLGQLMGTRYRESYVSDRLFNRVAALEGFHKILIAPGKKNTHIRVRLRELAELAGPPFEALVPRVEPWIDAALRERNHIGHGSRGDGHEAAMTLFIADAAYWLLVLCLLREAQAPPVVFDKLTGSGAFVWLRDNLAGALPGA